MFRRNSTEADLRALPKDLVKSELGNTGNVTRMSTIVLYCCATVLAVCQLCRKLRLNTSLSKSLHLALLSGPVWFRNKLHGSYRAPAVYLPEVT